MDDETRLNFLMDKMWILKEWIRIEKELNKIRLFESGWIDSCTDSAVDHLMRQYYLQED